MTVSLHHHDDGDLWQAPQTFREGLADLERVTGLLLDQLRGELLVPVDQIEFLARRVHRLAVAAHHALPPEVN